MENEILINNAKVQIRRLRLSPGEAMFWHTDTCRRYTTVSQGSTLRIEFAPDGDIAREDEVVFVATGSVGWDEVEPLIHRAVNVGDTNYEEVVTFCKPHPQIVVQPNHGDDR